VGHLGLTFPVLLDQDGADGTLYQLRGHPTTFLVGRDGVVQEVVVGEATDEAVIARKVTALLGE